MADRTAGDRAMEVGARVAKPLAGLAAILTALIGLGVMFGARVSVLGVQFGPSAVLGLALLFIGWEIVGFVVFMVVMLPVAALARPFVREANADGKASQRALRQLLDGAEADLQAPGRWMPILSTQMDQGGPGTVYMTKHGPIFITNRGWRHNYGWSNYESFAVGSNGGLMINGKPRVSGSILVEPDSTDKWIDKLEAHGIQRLSRSPDPQDAS